MIKKEDLRKIFNYVETQHNKEIAFEKAINVLMDRDIESDISSDIEAALNLLFVNTIELTHEPDRSWFNWFVHECKFGKKPLKARINNKEYLVDSFDVFYEVLVAVEKINHTEFKQEANRGLPMWHNVYLHKKYNEHSLCTHCIKHKPAKADNCKIAEAVFNFNIDNRITTPVYECQLFKQNQNDKK